MTQRPDNQFRQWAEALLGKAINEGDTVDSRDLIGRRALLELEVHPKRGWYVSGVAPCHDTPGPARADLIHRVRARQRDLNQKAGGEG